MSPTFLKPLLFSDAVAKTIKMENTKPETSHSFLLQNRNGTETRSCCAGALIPQEIDGKNLVTMALRPGLRVKFSEKVLSWRQPAVCVEASRDHHV